MGEKTLRAHNDSCIFKTVALNDIGLVGSSSRKRQRQSNEEDRPQGPISEFAIDLREFQELQQLGLPTSFGPSQKSRDSSSTMSAIRTAPHRNHAGRAQQKKHIWHQAYDYSTQNFYYYCIELQQTQWHPPHNAEFIPAPEYAFSKAVVIHEVMVDNESPRMKNLVHGVDTTTQGKQRDNKSSPCEEALDSDNHDRRLQQHDEIMEGEWDGHQDQSNASVVAHAFMYTMDGTDGDPMGSYGSGCDVKWKPRKESTGMLPSNVQSTGTHTYFESSSDGEDTGQQGAAIGAAAAVTHDGEDAYTDIAMRNLEDDLEHLSVATEATMLRTYCDGEDKRELPLELHKYWLQRYSLFSLYDRGIQIDEAGWYSITPEVIACHHAQRMVDFLGKGCLVVDACAGVGGNSIQLAMAGCHVIAVEKDLCRAHALLHNAKIYNVAHKIDVLCADFLSVSSKLHVDAVFASPPWGGPRYASDPVFDVENMGGCPELGLSRLLGVSLIEMKCNCFVAWLPRNSSTEQICDACLAYLDRVVAGGDDKKRNGHKVEIEKTFLNEVAKGISVYYGFDVDH